MVEKKRFGTLCLLGIAVGGLLGLWLQNPTRSSFAELEGQSVTGARVATEASLEVEAAQVVEGTLKWEALLKTLELNQGEKGGFRQEEVMYLGVNELRFEELKIAASALIRLIEGGKDALGKRYWGEVMGILVYRWAAVNLEEALAFFSSEGFRWLSQTIEASAKYDPSRSYEYVKGLQNPKSMKALLQRAKYFAGKYGEDALVQEIDALLSTFPGPKVVPVEPKPEKDPFSMMEEILANWEGSKSRNELNQYVTAALSLDSNATLSLLERVPLKERKRALQNAYSVLARTDPEEAFKQVKERASEEGHLDLTMIASVLASSDMEKFGNSKKWFVENLDTNELLVLFSGRSHLNTIPSQLLDLAFSLPSSLSLLVKIENSVNNWSQRDPKRALRWASEHLEEKKLGGIHAQLLRVEYKGDLDGTLKYLNQHMDTEYGMDLSRYALQSWPPEKLDDALLWVIEHPNASLREVGIQSLGNAWIEKDPEEALAFAGAMEVGKVKDQLFRELVGKYQQTESPESVLDLVSKIGDANLRNQLLSDSLNKIGNYDPMTALTYLDEMDVPKEAEERSQWQIVRHWKDKDPQGAFEYAVDAFEGPNQGQFLGTIAAEWLRGDFENASRAVDRIQDPELSLSLAERLVNDQNLVRMQPEYLLSVVEGLPDSDRKLNLAERLNQVYQRSFN